MLNSKKQPTIKDVIEKYNNKFQPSCSENNKNILNKVTSILDEKTKKASSDNKKVTSTKELLANVERIKKRIIAKNLYNNNNKNRKTFSSRSKEKNRKNQELNTYKSMSKNNNLISDYKTADIYIENNESILAKFSDPKNNSKKENKN